MLVEQSADYVRRFLAALRAGLVAVPLFAPGLPGHAGRLAAVLADCAPRCVLTTPAGRDAELFEPTDGTRPAGGADRRGPRPAVAGDPTPDDVAYLQYTSGRPARPAGVVITPRAT